MHSIALPVTTSTLRVLVVDDDQLDRFVIRRSFQALGTPVDLIEIADAKDAVSAINDNALDVTLLDIQMPQMDGFAVLEALRQDGPDKATTCPIMMLSSSTHTHDKDKALALGASEYRTKPATLNEYIRLAEDIRATYLQHT